MKRLRLHGAVLIAGLAAALPRADAGVRVSATHLAGVAFDVIPACRFPVGVVSHSDENDMPAALRDAGKQKLGYLVPPKAPFDATDVVMTGHNRRLIFIWVRGDTWVIATEHGGRGYNDPILAYTVDPKTQLVKLVAEPIAFPNSMSP